MPGRISVSAGIGTYPIILLTSVQGLKVRSCIVLVLTGDWMQGISALMSMLNSYARLCRGVTSQNDKFHGSETRHLCHGLDGYWLNHSWQVLGDARVSGPAF